MDKPQGNYAEQKKLISKGYTLQGSIYLAFLKKIIIEIRYDIMMLGIGGGWVYVVMKVQHKGDL